MKLGPAGLQSVVITLALTGVFAARLRAQVAPATISGTPGAQQTGVAQQAGVGQPASDLVPVIVVFTGPANWDYVGGTGPGGSFGSGPGLGFGGGLSIPYASSGSSTQPMSFSRSAASSPSTTPNIVPAPASVQASAPTRQGTNSGMAVALPGSMPTRGPAPATYSTPLKAPVSIPQPAVTMKARSAPPIQSAPFIQPAPAPFVQAAPGIWPAPQPPIGVRGRPPPDFLLFVF